MNIKLMLVIFVIALFPGYASAGPMKQGPNDAPMTSDANASAFVGKIKTARGKGGFANPHLVMEATADDGSSSTFFLMKGATVTEVDGKQIDYMSNVKYGSKVEIRYSTIDGQKRVSSMHYLE